MFETTDRRLPVALGIALLSALLLSSLILGLMSGDVKTQILDILKVLRAGPKAEMEDAFMQSVIWQIRLPRVIAMKERHTRHHHDITLNAG